MSQIADCLKRISDACDSMGVAELSKRSGVPYTTIKSLAERGFRPKTVEVIESLLNAVGNAHLIAATVPAAFPAASSLTGDRPFTACPMPLTHPSSHGVDLAYTDKLTLLVGQLAGESAVTA